ncbi:putative 39S ribosomal protein L45, mitochondrial [Trichinella murrelli]|uniref:Large ribosomal subunit protein mL45 n=1 Tax=Trichinella murrelli TaxID=144512 RepID=A0A0V0TEI5_9BILA|nr:putative 39S ribosomal protein L45, mitochondrial [Trichinella murrelli]
MKLDMKFGLHPSPWTNHRFCRLCLLRGHRSPRQRRKISKSNNHREYLLSIITLVNADSNIHQLLMKLPHTTANLIKMIITASLNSQHGGVCLLGLDARKNVRIKVFVENVERETCHVRISIQMINCDGDEKLDLSPLLSLQNAPSVDLDDVRSAIGKILISKEDPYKINPSRVAAFLTDVETIGWERVSQISLIPEKVTFKIVDSDKRVHFLKVCYNDMNSTNLMWEDRSMIHLFEEFSNQVDRNRDFWNQLKSIDNNAYVIEPKNPTYKDNYRRIYLDEHVTLVIVVNIDEPRLLPDISLIGPENALVPFRDCMNRNGLFELEFQMPNEQSLTDELAPLECLICQSRESDDGNIPDRVCENCKCSFHQNCLKKWIRRHSKRSISFGMMAGPCPHCEKERKERSGATIKECYIVKEETLSYDARKGKYISTSVRLLNPFEIGLICIATSGTALANRHWNPKFKKLRGEKFLKVALPDYDKIREREEMSIKDLRIELKKLGIQPHRPWRERPIHISSSGTIFDEFVPDENENKVSLLVKGKGSRLVDSSKHVWRNSRAGKKIRSYDADFDPVIFIDEALKIYLDAHSALQNRDSDRLHELVTEYAYPEMWEELNLKSLRWQFVESVEPARVVQMRTSSVMQEDNIFAQVTVRMHTKQKLAIYDQFGRLYMGNETVPRDVLEYIVYEKHLSNLYGKWRLHGKIRPSWLSAKDNVLPTFVKPSVCPNATQEIDVQLEEQNIISVE